MNKGLKVNEEQKVSQDHLGSQVLQDLLDQLERQEHQEQMENLDHREYLEGRETKDLQGHQDVKADLDLQVYL